MIATLVSVLLLVVLAAGSYGVGALLLGRVRGWHSTGERALFAVPLGMGVIAYLVLVAGLLRGLNRPVLAVCLLLPLAALVGTLMHRRAEDEWPAVPKTARSPLEMAAYLALAGCALLTLIGALAPPGGNEWDALSYHLAVPKMWLRAGRIFYIPWLHQSNFPFTLQMLYTLMLGLGSVGAAKLCHWLCGVLLVLSVVTFGARHLAPESRGRTMGLLAACILAATPIVLWEASVAYVDLASALFTWLSLYALFNAAQAVRLPGLSAEAPVANHRAVAVAGRKGGKRRATTPRRSAVAEPEAPGTASDADSLPWLIVSALMMGLALGTKYTVLGFWGLMLVGILGWHVVTTGRWARVTLPHAALWGGISLALAAPWYVKTWLYTGNPVYPFYYGLFGGRYWNAANAAAYAADQARFGLGKDAVHLLLGPWQATMLGEGFTEYAVWGLPLAKRFAVWGLPPVYVALLLAAPFLLRRLSRTAVWLSLFGLGVYVFWFFLMQQTRYLIPALPALALVSAEVLVAVWDELPLARWLAAGIVALSVAWALGLALIGIAAPALPVVTGQMSASEYVPRTLRLRGLMSAIAFINRETPPGAKVALFDEVRGFYLDRPYIWATPNHSTILPWDRYTGVDDWLADFKRRGYTTLLVNAENPPAEDDGQRWRGLLRDAIADNKVTLAFEQTVGPGRSVQVYRIP